MMPVGQEAFNLEATLASLGQAFVGLVCHVGFEAALHGLVIALLVGLTGLVFKYRQTRFGKPLMAVSIRLSIFCLILLMPGLITLATSGHLPPSGTFEISSLGFIVFWSLICLHLSAEEMNYQWF